MERVLTIDEWREMVFALAKKYNVPGVIFAGMNFGRYSTGDELMTYTAHIVAANICTAYETSWVYSIAKIESQLCLYIPVAKCDYCGK